ncbi:unnamed protein product [Didymodactylos carnosus]|uniref:Uncharacterized protein n=1 Tax=Didymodactylos carnosus TaxID=1234261 RepID=A0A8S2T993_9BILA|nr:unnamed protein product [Didymodactylos carnosus]CAF4278031.1 unnamed protein product [Didymodactylos carnosus]
MKDQRKGNSKNCRRNDGYDDETPSWDFQRFRNFVFTAIIRFLVSTMTINRNQYRTAARSRTPESMETAENDNGDAGDDEGIAPTISEPDALKSSLVHPFRRSNYTIDEPNPFLYSEVCIPYCPDRLENSVVNGPQSTVIEIQRTIYRKYD